MMEQDAAIAGRTRDGEARRRAFEQQPGNVRGVDPLPARQPRERRPSVGDRPVDAARRRIAREDGASGREEPLEQGRGRGVQVLGHRREHDGPVPAAPDAQPGPVHGSVPRHDVLGPEVVFDLGRFHRVHEVLERLANPREFRRATLAGVVHPGGRRRLDEQDVVDLLSCRHRDRQPREVRGRLVVGVPPGLVVRERLRMIALACAAQRHVGQVLVQRVDPEHVEPVADALHVLEAEIPPAGAVGFRQRAGPAELVGDARHFLDRAHVAELGVHVLLVLIHQRVDARPLLPGRHRHVVRDGHRVGPLVLPVVARELDPVLLAVGIVRTRPALDELLEEELVVIVPHLLPVAERLAQSREVRHEAVAPARLEALREAVGPREPARGSQMWLVGEDAGDALAELAADLALVGVHRD